MTRQKIIPSWYHQYSIQKTNLQKKLNIHIHNQEPFLSTSVALMTIINNKKNEKLLTRNNNAQHTRIKHWYN